jgi:hypothetical protein
VVGVVLHEQLPEAFFRFLYGLAMIKIIHKNLLEQSKLTAWKRRVWSHAIFINPMKIRNITRRFFFRGEKAAGFKTGAEQQTGLNQKGPGVMVLFDMSGNQCGFALYENKPR